MIEKSNNISKLAIEKINNTSKLIVEKVINTSKLTIEKNILSRSIFTLKARAINKISNYEFRDYRYAIIKIRYFNNLKVLKVDNYFDINTFVILKDRVYILKTSNIIIKKLAISILIKDLKN